MPSYSPASKGSQEQARGVDQVVLDALHALHQHRMPTGWPCAQPSGFKVEIVVPSSTQPIAQRRRKIDQRLGGRGLAAGNQDVRMLLLAYFISVFLISAAGALSAFVAYFTKIIPHSKRFLNIPFEISGESTAKLHGPVLCKLTLRGVSCPQNTKKTRRTERVQRALFSKAILCYTECTASKRQRCCLHRRWSSSLRQASGGREKLIVSGSP